MSADEAKDLTPCTPDRLLITDDEGAIRTVFKQIVSMGLPHCRIDLAVNGAEGVESFRAVHHKVILLDLKMPVMDGETAFQKIKELCEEEGWEMPCVVFCTGYAPTQNIQKIVANSRRHRMLRKPVMNDKLLEVLKSRLEV